eukprot:TRINITY_DN9592_c0_g1_i3.p3 TRINITY_DN9592_c0_g1~~TRINITY_DN9592_c0_g1_i3.p3  ORF type:complete len:106 (+),score=1.20 TRINITY_DN9592_c0_g1_i3:66-383(+)
MDYTRTLMKHRQESCQSMWLVLQVQAHRKHRRMRIHLISCMVCANCHTAKSQFLVQTQKFLGCFQNYSGLVSRRASFIASKHRPDRNANKDAIVALGVQAQESKI